MRVQPHFPSRPLLAMVMPRSGLAWWACKAANRPAPPVPKIKTSVSNRSSMIPSPRSGGAHKKDERQHRGGQQRPRHQLLVASKPGQVLKQQDADASQQMQRQQEYEARLGDLDRGVGRPA